MHACEPAVLAAVAAGGHRDRLDGAGRRVRAERPVPRRHPRQRHPGLPPRLHAGVAAVAAAVAFFAGTLIHVADLGGSAIAGARGGRDRHVRRRPAAPAASTSPRRRARRRGARHHPPQQPHARQGDGRRTGTDRGRERHRATRRGTARALRRGRGRAVRGRGDRRRRAARCEPTSRRLGDGTFRGAFTIDGDGVDPDREFGVEVEVGLDRGSIHVDFTGTSPQARGAINSSFSQTLSGVVYAVRCFVDPAIPMNEGCFRPLRTTLPSGTLVNPDGAGGVRRPRHDGRGRGRGHPRRARRRPARPRRRRELVDPRLHAQRAAGRRDAVAEPVLRVRRARGPGGRGRSRRHRRLLPGRAVGAAADRAARGAVPDRSCARRACGRTRAVRVGGGAASASRPSSSCSPTPWSRCAATAWTCRHPGRTGARRAGGGDVRGGAT